MYGGVDVFMICLCIKFHTNSSCGTLSVTIKSEDTDMRTEAILLFYALQQYYLYFSTLSPNINPGIKASGSMFSATLHFSASAMQSLQL